jgi:hypothetical protein
MSEFLLGESLDETRFEHVAGDQAVRTALLRALRAMASLG